MASAVVSSSLSAQSIVQDGTTVDFTTAKANVSGVMGVTGTVTGGLVVLEASHDGTVWVNVASLVPDTGINQFFSSPSGAFRYWRANITSAVVGGGTVSATFMEAG